MLGYLTYSWGKLKIYQSHLEWIHGSKHRSYPWDRLVDLCFCFHALTKRFGCYNVIIDGSLKLRTGVAIMVSELIIVNHAYRPYLQLTTCFLPMRTSISIVHHYSWVTVHSTDLSKVVGDHLYYGSQKRALLKFHEHQKTELERIEATIMACYESIDH